MQADSEKCEQLKEMLEMKITRTQEEILNSVKKRRASQGRNQVNGTQLEKLTSEIIE